MKSFIILSLIFLSSMPAKAQNCAGYYYLTKNATVVMSNYDRKDKINSTVTYKINNVSNNNDGVSASFESVVVDEKGKTISNSKGQYKCADGKIYVDASVSMPAGQMEAYKNMEITANEGFIEYPSSMQDGQQLPDASFKMTVSNKGAVFSNITYKQVNRKVTGKEKIATTAGSWDCWKITSESQFKATIGDSNFGIPINMISTEWFAPGFGIVKTETANKNNKLMGYSVISMMEK